MQPESREAHPVCIEVQEPTSDSQAVVSRGRQEKFFLTVSNIGDIIPL
jgi:hypothetical protein